MGRIPGASSRVVVLTTILTTILTAMACQPRERSATRPEAQRATTGDSGVETTVRPFRDLVAGDNHSCVAGADGAVFCWGSSEWGAVPSESDDLYQPRPVRVIGLGDVVQLAATSNDTCALDADGVVSCWGNTNGEATRAVEGLATDAVELVMCQDEISRYQCTRHRDGTVRCWGEQHLDDAAGKTLLPSATPVVIPSLRDADALACQGHVACAKRRSGDAYCWGAVELGDEYQAATSAPTPPPTPLPPFTAALANETSFGAVSSCRDERCWAVARTSEGPRFKLAGVRGIAAGPNHRCRIETSGAVRCSRTENGAPDPALADLRAYRIAVGATHACALETRGGIACWGDNSDAQLGDGRWGNIVPTPTRVAGVRAPRQLKSSRRYSQHPWRTLAITEDGGLVGWGRSRQAARIPFRAVSVAQNGTDICAVDESGGLRCAKLADSTVTTEWSTVPGVSDLAALDAGGEHFCARDSAKLARCWGSNRKGALGNSNPAVAATPVTVAGLADVEQIATGDAHSCARARDGGIHCWGKGTHNRLGNGSSQTRRRPTHVVGVKDAVDLSVGKDTSCAVQRDGAVMCWGRPFEPYAKATNEVERVPLSSPATRVSVGCTHACAITGGGALECWGLNSAGELGAPPKRRRYGEPQVLEPRVISALPPARAVALGCFSSCIEATDGAVHCWGERHTIGDGSEARSDAPTAVIAPVGGWLAAPTP